MSKKLFKATVGDRRIHEDKISDHITAYSNGHAAWRMWEENTVVTGRYYYPDQEKDAKTEETSDDADESAETTEKMKL